MLEYKINTIFFAIIRIYHWGLSSSLVNEITNLEYVSLSKSNEIWNKEVKLSRHDS